MTDRSEDEAAVLAVVRRMNAAFAEGDFEAYASVFVHEDRAAWWNASPLNGNFVRQGWTDTAPRLALWMAERSANDTRGGEAVVENLHVRVSDTIAWVTFTRRYAETPAHRASPNPAHQLRILEKTDGEWRVVLVGFLDPTIGRPNSSVIRLDAKGNVLWMNTSAKEALAAEDELVVRNGRLRIRNSEADRTLQASIRWAAALDRAFLPARGAVPVVLEAGEGIAAKVWWVIGDGGAIFFSLGEPDHVAHQLDAAAAVYGLSPAQKAVAGQIIEGRALGEIADSLKVRHNTVRTHLDRVFEKTGVRTQAALVRIILSTGAPL